MSFKLKVKEADLAKASTGGSFIGTSGIYDVTILAVTVDENEHGATTLGFYVDYNDNKQMLYGALPLATYDNKNVLEGNHKTFGTLCTIADVDLETDFQPVDASLPIGKGGAAKDVAILEEFEDVPVKMWVKQEFYRKGDGSIGENRIVNGLFRASDNASSDEIINGSEAGVKYARQEKYFTDVKYGTDKAPVTKEEVDAMIEARKSGGSAPTAKPAAAAPKRSKFAK